MKSDPQVRRIAELHKAGKLLAVAVDEAHLISSWGRDFRKHYRELGSLRASLPGVPFLAFTATASPSVRADIVASLGLTNTLVSSESIYREHLHLARELRPHSAQRTLERVSQLLGEHGAARRMKCSGK